MVAQRRAAGLRPLVEHDLTKIIKNTFSVAGTIERRLAKLG
jgi:hypothetical protein